MIVLPTLFSKKLASSPELAASVAKTFNLFEPWLEQSGMPFFPGFTDHSPRHISDVLDAAASLISDSSHDLLSAEDVAVLCMAILLHDCGMHLTQDAFRALVEESTQPIIQGLGDLPWSQIWHDFLAEAGRYGQEKLVAIFGDSEPLQINKLDLNNLSERDCLLIGEFVRRHHTRIAHEISVRGISKKGGVPLELGFDDAELRDLAGLIARSHGMSIRSTFEYIEDRYGLVPVYRKIKTPFLMAVLRIADYVQVKSERAIRALLSVKELRSPISRQEWLAHFSVKDVSTAHADPEAFYVHATPVDVKTYLKLVALFKDIQKELDESWATLGEVYGRSGELSNIGLTMRRIRSNLDSVKKFERTVNYLPIKARFDSSGPDLLKLLVGPLYEYKVEVGVRELLQNAIDACREAADLIGGNKFPSELKVVVDVYESENGSGWVTISDSGVGMTIDTITKYFLIAGASFRNSDIWKRQHINESGIPRITRGGRFGVGALAAFLLGDEISLITRHVSRSESDGIEFSARIDDPVLELRRCRAPAGTTIKISISDPKIFDELRPYAFGEESADGEGVLELGAWRSVDWFVQEFPSVKYQWTGYQNSHKKEPGNSDNPIVHAVFYPKKNDFAPLDGLPDSDWNALDDPSPFSALLWRFVAARKIQDEDKYSILSADEIVVNGIRVQKVNTFRPYIASVNFIEKNRFSAPSYFLNRPSMAIYDPSGICPINLQRSSVAFERMGFEEKLAVELLRSHISEFEKNSFKCSMIKELYELCDIYLCGKGVSYDSQIMPIFYSEKGFSLVAREFLVASKIKKIIVLDNVDPGFSIRISDFLADDEALLLRKKKIGIQEKLAWFRTIISPSTTYYSSGVGLPDLEYLSSYSIVSNGDWKFINEKKRVRRDLLKSVGSYAFGDAHTIIFSGANDPIKERLEEIFSIFGAASGISIISIGDSGDSFNQSLIADVWKASFPSGFFQPETEKI